MIRNFLSNVEAMQSKINIAQAEINANTELIPSEDNMSNIGTSNLRYKDLHLAGTATMNSLTTGTLFQTFEDSVPNESLTVTLTASDLASGFIGIRDAGADVTVTFESSINIINALGFPNIGDTLEFVIYNQSGSHTVTLTGSDNIGSAIPTGENIVNGGKARTYRLRRINDTGFYVF